MKTLTLDLGDRSYPITIGKDEFGSLGEDLSGLLAGNTPILITSPSVQRHCFKKISKVLPGIRKVVVPDGERAKNLTTVKKIYSDLLRCGADRKTTLVLLGGGVVGDLGGFVASTYMRGIPFIQIPTTLIGQVDSAIGGKVGVDLPEGKNLIGSFYQPQMVGIEVSFLKTLPPREFQSGLAEVIKYGLIQDPALLDLVSGTTPERLPLELDRLQEMIVRSVGIKAHLVSGDEKEQKGVRTVLNFGHTFGHALERLTRYRRFRHGEAIAVGMSVSAEISARLGHCSGEVAHRVKKIINDVHLPLTPPSFSKRDWLHSIMVDKKKQQGMIQFVFLKDVGQVVVEAMEPRELVSLAFSR